MENKDHLYYLPLKNYNHSIKNDYILIHLMPILKDQLEWLIAYNYSLFKINLHLLPTDLRYNINMIYFNNVKYVKDSHNFSFDDKKSYLIYPFKKIDHDINNNIYYDEHFYIIKDRDDSLFLNIVNKFDYDTYHIIPPNDDSDRTLISHNPLIDLILRSKKYYDNKYIYYRKTNFPHRNEGHFVQYLFSNPPPKFFTDEMIEIFFYMDKIILKN